jgi:hypothetical protein
MTVLVSQPASSPAYAAFNIGATDRIIQHKWNRKCVDTEDDEGLENCHTVFGFDVFLNDGPGPISFQSPLSRHSHPPYPTHNTRNLQLATELRDTIYLIDI